MKKRNIEPINNARSLEKAKNKNAVSGKKHANIIKTIKNNYG